MIGYKKFKKRFRSGERLIILMDAHGLITPDRICDYLKLFDARSLIKYEIETGYLGEEKTKQVRIILKQERKEGKGIVC